MISHLQNILKDIGLSEKEAATYLANLEIGTNTANLIARNARLSRTTTYSVLLSLKKKGLVSSYERSGVQYFTALSGSELVSNVRHEMMKKVQLVESVLPQLEVLHFSHVKPPKVQYFEGLEGIQHIYEDTLQRDVPEKLAYSSIPEITDPLLQTFIHNYLEKRKEKKLKVRAIFPDTPAARVSAKDDNNVLRISRFAPPNTHLFKSEINIYENKMAIMSLVPPHYHGVIIESPEIAETQRAIFELAWERCQ
jgi:sugar-specific transcriptional regulator TrmB